MTSALNLIPSLALSAVSVSIENLDALKGKHIDEICGKYHKDKDKKINHCAHFVSHVMELRITGAALCSNVEGTEYSYEERRNGFCIRVDQVFNSCANRSEFADDVLVKKRIIVATIPANYTDKANVKIGDNERKHIGFLIGANVYHYSNSKKQVVCVPVSEFKRHYGAGTILFVADLP